MALNKLPCGDWVEIPAEALAGENQFRRWYKEHHLPFCQKNQVRRPIRPVIAQARGPQQLIVVRFTEQLNHPELEIIPERAGATWRVLNRRTQSWPIVHVGDYLVINDLRDVQVISAEAFEQSYEIVPEQPGAPAESGGPVDDDVVAPAGTAGTRNAG